MLVMVMTNQAYWQWEWKVIMSPLPLAQGGTSRFTVVSHRPNVCWRPSVCIRPRLCHTLFTQYFLQFFTSDFQIFRYGDHGQDRELIHFLWSWLNFQGHRGHYVSKLTLFMRYFLYFVLMAFKLRHLVNIDKTFKLLTFCDCASIFKVTLCFKIIHFVL